MVALFYFIFFLMVRAPTRTKLVPQPTVFRSFKPRAATAAVNAKEQAAALLRRRTRIECQLVRLLKLKGSLSYPIAPQLPAMSPSITSTEIDAAIERLCQREYAEKIGVNLNYVA